MKENTLNDFLQTFHPKYLSAKSSHKLPVK